MFCKHCKPPKQMQPVQEFSFCSPMHLAVWQWIWMPDDHMYGDPRCPWCNTPLRKSYHEKTCPVRSAWERIRSQVVAWLEEPTVGD